jgi:hypothetical protein
MVDDVDSDAQQTALSVARAVETGDLAKVNAAIGEFMDATAERASYDRELAYDVALDGEGVPAFDAKDVHDRRATRTS